MTEANTIHFAGRSILPIIRDFLILDPENSISVADVGCYKRPIFASLSKLKEFVDFTGVDEDLAALEYLRENNLNAQNFSDYATGPIRDYSFGLEVIEHIKNEGSADFLSVLRDKSRKAFFLTTPNFEGWDADGNARVERREEFAEMRYIPDHLKYFNAASSDPHYHKQIMTKEILSNQFQSILGPDDWDWEVFKAWPWRLIDDSVGTEFVHYFKLFAVAWRHAEFATDTRNYIKAFAS